MAATGLPLRQGEINGSIGSSPAFSVQRNWVYIGSYDGRIRALSPSQNGFTTEWSKSTGAMISASPVLSPDESLVFIGTQEGQFYALDSVTGAERWRVELEAPINATAAIGPDGTVYIGADNGRLVALSPLAGQEKWRFNATGQIGASPVVGKAGLVYVGTSAGHLYALDGQALEANVNAQAVWEFQANGGISSPMLGDNGVLYVGTHANEFLAISTLTHQKLWGLTLGGRVTSSAVRGESDTIFVTTYDDGKLTAIDPDARIIKWSMPLTENGEAIYASALVGDQGNVYVGAFDGRVYALDPTKYNSVNPGLMLLWSYETNSSVVASPALDPQGLLYISSLNSTLYAIETGESGLHESDWPMIGGSLSHRNYQSNLNTIGIAAPLTDASTSIRMDLEKPIPKSTFIDRHGGGELQYSLSGTPAWSGVLNNVILGTPMPGDEGVSQVTYSATDKFGFTAESSFKISVVNIDLDNDGIQDEWEELYGLNSGSGQDASSDADGDGATNLEEFLAGTHPGRNDTDGDGINDGWELQYGYNPKDGSDGFLDLDNDGLTTLQEFKHKTNPSVADTDGDGMKDGWEVSYQLNPLDSGDKNLDPDGDWLHNIEEYAFNTSPRKWDTDGDGVHDGEEVADGTDPTLNIAAMLVVINQLLLN